MEAGFLLIEKNVAAPTAQNFMVQPGEQSCPQK